MFNSISFKQCDCYFISYLKLYFLTLIKYIKIETTIFSPGNTEKYCLLF